MWFSFSAHFATRPIGFNVGFQRILDRGGVGSQGSREGIDEHIGLVEILGFIQIVGVFIPIHTIGQIQGFQKICALGFVDAIEKLHLSAAVLGGFGLLGQVGNAQIRKLHPGDGIAMAGAAVAQVAGFVRITCTVGTNEGVVNALVIDAGRIVGTVPNAVLFSVMEKTASIRSIA